MLKRKGLDSEAAWWDAWNLTEGGCYNGDPDTLWVDVAEAETKAAAEILLETLPKLGDRPVWSWSGGKDSLALQVVMYEAGLLPQVPGVCAIVGPLEVPAFLEWLGPNLPPGVEILSRDDWTLERLAASPQYLFPATSRLGYFWTMTGTRWAQLRFYRERDATAIILGRRRVDGNFVPDGGLHESADMLQFCPIAHWSHELTLAAIHYAGLSLPPTYYWPNGWKAGTGPWPGRRTQDSDADAWTELREIDPAVLAAAAAYFPGAAAALE